MTKRLIGGDSARQQAHLQDTPLHLAYSQKKRTLGDKLHELARLSPKHLALVEAVVDCFLEILKSA